MKLAMVALVALLAGCATPGDVRRDGVREEFALKLPVADATRCMRRNAEEYSGLYTVTQHDNEVILRYSDSTVAVAEARPSGSGSAMTIWRAAMVGNLIGLPAAMAKGC